MKLYELYEDVMVREAWAQLEQELGKNMVLAEEGDGKLDLLLKEADMWIFPAFGINSSEKKYFIAGSARLYIYPGLIEFLNEFSIESDKAILPIPTVPGDLDIIVPGEGEWQYLNEFFTNGKGKEKNIDMEHFDRDFKMHIYRPGGQKGLGLSNMDVESFIKWNPALAGGEFAHVKVDDPEPILGRASEVNGHYFMSLYDVLHYKGQMTRDKEVRIAQIISDFIKNSNGESESVLLAKLVNIIKRGVGIK